MPDPQPPKTISPEAREVIQGIYAGTQNEGVRIAGLAEIESIEDTPVGSKDNPTNLGPTVEISVSLDADGNPIPQIEDRDDFQPASAVMTIRVTPQREFGGEFFTAHVRVVDVATSRIIHSERSGATREQQEQLQGGRPESEYGNDPEFYEGLLALESDSIEEAVAVAVRGATASVGAFERSTSPSEPARPDEQTGTGPGTTRAWFDSLPGGWPILAAAGGAVALLVAILLFGGSSGPSGPWSATDPRNDFEPTFAGVEAIEHPSSAGDVTAMLVEVADGNTTVTVTFAGDAQGLHAEGGEELAAALQFIPVGGERFIDMLFKEYGETKISDPPAGASIRSTWTAPNTLVFEITGLTPAKGATVRFATIQRLRSGHSTDEVLVSTGDEGSSLVTSEPVNAPSTRAPAPLVIQPCDVIDSALAASLAGITTEPIQSGDDRRQNCTYPFPPGDGATGNSLVMEVVRNSAGGVLEAYRNNNDGANETRSIVWSDEGEMWIRAGDDGSRVAMLAYVDIPGSRRVYVTVTIHGTAASASSMASAAETISALLNEAVLEAQP